MCPAPPSRGPWAHRPSHGLACSPLRSLDLAHALSLTRTCFSVSCIPQRPIKAEGSKCPVLLLEDLLESLTQDVCAQTTLE